MGQRLEKSSPSLPIVSTRWLVRANPEDVAKKLDQKKARALSVRPSLSLYQTGVWHVRISLWKAAKEKLTAKETYTLNEYGADFKAMRKLHGEAIKSCDGREKNSWS